MDNKITNYILKHSKKKDRELKYDFMPSMLEIIERPAHIGGTIIIIGIFTLIIAAVIWASLSKVDVVVNANGSIKPIGDLNVVKSLYSGAIEKICVTEGKYVKKGEMLLVLNTDSVNIDVENIKYQIKIVDSQLDIYNKIASGKDITKRSLDSYSDKVKPYIKKIIESEKSYKNTLDSLELDKSTADLNKKISQVQLDEYKSEGTKSQQNSQELIIQQYDLAYKKAEINIKNLIVDHNEKNIENISELNSKRTELDLNLKKYDLAKKSQQITSPVNGYINSIGINTIGGVVTSTQELFSIVPENAKMEMICYVKNRDIADIKVGMNSEIKLEAYPYNKYGTIEGKIDYISPSSFTMEQLGNVYLVKIKTNNTNKNINIISGLTGTVEIKTDKRSIMNYFLDPILKGLDESLKEK